MWTLPLRTSSAVAEGQFVIAGHKSARKDCNLELFACLDSMIFRINFNEI
jgi:hypothetical protein